MRKQTRVVGIIALGLAGLLILSAGAARAEDDLELCWTAQSEPAAGLFGRSVAGAGDVNCDGYADVIVGAPNYTNGQYREGCVFLYYGSPSGLSISPDWVAEGNQKNAAFGVCVACAGDVNADGYSDVIVGAQRYTNGQSGEGRAFVYHGGPGGLSDTPAWTAEGNQAGGRFGTSVAGAGDVNNDGYSDVIVGASYYDNPLSNEGRAFVYHGGPGGLSLSHAWTAEGDFLNARFGSSVAGAGDTNGDGYSDVVVGAPNFKGARGLLSVYFGSPSGLAPQNPWKVEGDQSNSWFGCSVASAGDVNGDGYSEVVVGAWLYDSGQFNEGRAVMYSGGPAGPCTPPMWSAEGNSPNAYFGFSVAGAGDLNGDGFPEAIVGAKQYAYEGMSCIYCGCELGCSETPEWVLFSGYYGAEFGSSVACAGDVNGDGVCDVIVGGPGRSLAHVYCGYTPALEATVDFDPNTLNLKSKGNFVTCYIELPEGYDPGDIDVGTVLLDEFLPARLSPTAVGDHDADGTLDRMVKFSRSGLIAAIAAEDEGVWVAERGTDPPIDHGEEFEVCITGYLSDGTPFAGTDVIRVIDPPPEVPEADPVLVVSPTILRDHVTISYRADPEEPVTLRVFDATGRLVRTLVNGRTGTGLHQVTWDRRTETGKPVGPGMYLISLQGKDLVGVRKVLVVK